MVPGFLPLVDEHDDKQCRHDELDACRIKMYDISQKGSRGRACDPVDLVEQRDEKHKPAFVNIRGRRHGAVDRKGFVAHPIDQIGLFPTRILVLFQHGDPVEQVPRIDHQRQEKGMQRMKGGQQQRVAIARSLIYRPALLLADEPTGNLDRKNGEEIIDLLKLSNRNLEQTILLITHDEKIALEADRVITIEDGKIVGDQKRR